VAKWIFPHLKDPRWVADLGKIEQPDGTTKRVVRTFKTKKEADEFLETKKEKLRRHGHTALALTEEDRIVFEAARDRLAKAGATIS